VDFLSELDTPYVVLVRGLRDGYDLAYENQLATINSHLKQNLQTIYFPCDPEYGYISSTLVRALVENNGSITGLVCNKEVEKFITDPLYAQELLK
jgi:pantetheine-phosphate adenylyltransferase